MRNKDEILLQEAYLSATGKIPSTPADTDYEKEEENEEGENEETGEEPMVISIGGPVDGEEGNEEQPPHTFSDDKDESWQDHENEEIRMVKTNLFTIAEDAKMLHDAIHSGEEIEPWMQQKIAVASEMICGVAKVVRYYTAKVEAGLE